MKKQIILAASITSLLGLVSTGLTSTAQAVVYTWNGLGGDNNWGTSGNWGGSAPAPGTTNDLHFAGSTRLTPFNNYTAFDDFQDIIFDSGAGSFSISGNSLDIFGKIENLSSNLQTFAITSFSMNSATRSELDASGGDLTIALTGGGNNIFNNGNTINVFGDSNKTLTLASGTVMTGTGGFFVKDRTNVVINSAQTYTGTTSIDAGKLTTASTLGNNTGAIFIGNGGNGNLVGNVAKPLYGNTDATFAISASGLTLANNITTNKADAAGSAGSGTRIIQTTYSGTSTLTGTIAVNGGLVFDVGTGGTLNIGNAGVGGQINDGSDTGVVLRSVTKKGLGTVILSSANGYTGTTTVAASGGTLTIDSGSAGTGRLAGTSGITVNSGGTLLLAQSGSASTDRINNAATMNLAGGTFDLNGKSEGAAGTTGIGNLTLSANSTLDFGAATNENNSIQFLGLGTHTAGTVLAITDWNGTAATGGGPERLLFAGTLGGVSSFNTLFGQNDVSFNGSVGYAAVQFSGFYEITAVPEPTTIFGALWLVGLVGYRESRRITGAMRGARA